MKKSKFQRDYHKLAGHMALSGLTKLLLSCCCTKPSYLTAFLAALKMISETYESIPIIEAILLGPCLSMDSIVKSECTSASLRPSAISSVCSIVRSIFPI